MTRLATYTKELYELRFSPMCKPAAEVANVTLLESHSTRARTMLMWRIAEGIINWNEREVELIYQSTLDSISEAFDVFHYPVSQMMLAARADIWDAGLAPQPVRQAIEAAQIEPDPAPTGDTLLLAGEIAQLGDRSLLDPIRSALQQSGVTAAAWVTPSGAPAYALGAWNVAQTQLQQLAAGIKASGAKTVIADGPETAWALLRICPALNIDLPGGVSIKLLSEVLAANSQPARKNLGKVFVHDSRAACLIADEMAGSLAILPGYTEDETQFGKGSVYDAPRQLLDALGAQRVYSTWTRSLAKSSGADDGLWLTYPKLADALARQRLDYAQQLGAQLLVTDSPLAASFLDRHAIERDITVKFLAELLN